MTVYQLRRYRLRPGAAERWLDFFESVVRPGHEEQGMTVVDAWLEEEPAADDARAFVWIRSAESHDALEQADARYRAAPRRAAAGSLPETLVESAEVAFAARVGRTER